MTELDPPPRPIAPWRERVELLVQTPPLTPSRVAGGVLAVLALLLAGWLLLRTPTGPPTEDVLPLASEVRAPQVTTSMTSGVLVAHAAGAVVDPGVYELPAGSRVRDLVDAAGGALPDADLHQLNLAAALLDGERVYVPRIGEVVTMPSQSVDDPNAPIDLNTATLDQLDALPGIGPATAQAILDERDRRGGFASVDDLLDVRGIGPAKLEVLRDLVRV